MKKVKNQGRQGDVLIQRTGRIPAKARKADAEQGRIILAHGEATGHHHSLDIDDADWWKSEQEQFVEIKTAKAKIVHQEHAPVPLAKGSFRVLRQKEYHPAAIRNVAD